MSYGPTLLRIVKALERIADADERRNDLLEADLARRDLAWAEQRAAQDSQWADLMAAAASGEPAPTVDVRPDERG